MALCSFCGNRIMKGTGKINNYCSRKCEKNDLKLQRKARDLKWTKHFKKNV